MFLYFSEYLIEWFSPLNAFTYITTRGILAALTALVISFLFGPKIIEKLQGNKIGETIRSDGPSTHSSKGGTPTMGGLMIILSILVSVLIWSDLSNLYNLVLIASIISFGFIGLTLYEMIAYHLFGSSRASQPCRKDGVSKQVEQSYVCAAKTSSNRAHSKLERRIL